MTGRTLSRPACNFRIELQLFWLPYCNWNVTDVGVSLSPHTVKMNVPVPNGVVSRLYMYCVPDRRKKFPVLAPPEDCTVWKVVCPPATFTTDNRGLASV